MLVNSASKAISTLHLIPIHLSHYCLFLFLLGATINPMCPDYVMACSAIIHTWINISRYLATVSRNPTELWPFYLWWRKVFCSHHSTGGGSVPRRPQAGWLAGGRLMNVGPFGLREPCDKSENTGWYNTECDPSKSPGSRAELMIH